MAVNEAFWVGAAAAAPVIGLTHAVTYGRMLHLHEADVAKAQPGPHRRWAAGLTVASYMIALASFAADGLVMIYALHTLTLANAGVGTGMAQIVLGVTFLIVVFQGLLEVAARQWLAEIPKPAQRHRRERSSPAAPD
jgi:hypothetical protein